VPQNPLCIKGNSTNWYITWYLRRINNIKPMDIGKQQIYWYVAQRYTSSGILVNSYRRFGATCCFIFSSRFGLMLYCSIKFEDRRGPLQTAILLHIRLQTLAFGDNHLSTVLKKRNIMGLAGFQEQVTSSPSNPLLTMTSIKLKALEHTHTHTHTHTALLEQCPSDKVFDVYSGGSRSESFMWH
jgi:hypothetical protein